MNRRQLPSIAALLGRAGALGLTFAAVVMISAPLAYPAPRTAMGMASAEPPNANGDSGSGPIINLPRDGDAATNAGSKPLTLTYFGAAGWRISDGETVVLVDPWPSRIKYGGGGHPEDTRPAYARSDPAPIDRELVDRLIPEADYILMQHGHFDHLGDVPHIALKTGAKIVGTETVMMILRAYGVPDEQLYAVQGGEDYQFDGFSVRVVPGLHSALDGKHYHDSRRYDRSTELRAPLRIEQFIEGGALSFLIRMGDRRILTMGSMNFIEREFEGLEPDILLAGINGSRLGLYDYDRRLLESTGFPPVVLPTHWDNFRLPYDFSQQANIERNLLPFIEKAGQVSPESKVLIPVHLQPIVIE